MKSTDNTVVEAFCYRSLTAFVICVCCSCGSQIADAGPIVFKASGYTPSWSDVPKFGYSTTDTPVKGADPDGFDSRSGSADSKSSGSGAKSVPWQGLKNYLEEKNRSRTSVSRSTQSTSRSMQTEEALFRAQFQMEQQMLLNQMMQQNMMMDSGSFTPMPSGGSSFSTPKMNTKRYCPKHGEWDTRGGTFSCPGCMAPKYGF